MPVRRLEDGDNIGHMRRKGGKALLDALLVADIRQHMVKDGKTGAIRRRHKQPAHGHQGEKPQRLEGDRLAAGIGAGDDQGIEIAAQPDVDGDDFIPGDQRVARFF